METTGRYVLCLYYKDDSRKSELAERARTDNAEVSYRYWKSDQSTLSGKYSEEFLSKLTAEQRNGFTTPKRTIKFKDSKGKIILRQTRKRKGRTKVGKAG